MLVKTLKVGQLQTNCYLFYDDDSRQCLIIDPGDDADLIVNQIKDLDLKPEAILATHGHFDHILAVAELKLAFKIPFYLNAKDAKILKRQQSTGQYFLGYPVDPVVPPDKYLKAGVKVKAGKLPPAGGLKVMATPGHTPGSVSFYCQKQNLVFGGDLIFSHGGYGRTDLKGGDFEQLQKSIAKILKLPAATMIYPGHGEKTQVKLERKYYGSI
jgi:hydroxyacylglutathione hydrolase